MKVAVGTPWSSPFIYTEYVDSVLNLRAPEGCEIRFFRGRGWCPARAHTHLCEQALKWDADVVVILGADQVYEEDLLERLMGRYREGYVLLGAMVPTRGHLPDSDMKPFQPLAWELVDGKAVVVPKDGTLRKADVIGTGVVLFGAHLLRSLKRPWFTENINEETYRRIPNQDARFMFRMASENKVQLWVDTSIEVKHLHIFSIDGTYQERFADWKDPNKGDSSICPTDWGQCKGVVAGAN